ncbi:hypothetical protein NF867_07140 [Solitalea sp. MAHUQ-68]|uniref:SRPBCC family protein n=1 Tax=Solitalea agri TaxID=2953739 RepID=A0A9X2JD88_9SPHI|nr:hypothetical protein [Solitalea agri]MCO4292630.1 hypothetical protein [Solitalea agri]
MQLANFTTLNYFRHAGQWNGTFFAPASSTKTSVATVKALNQLIYNMKEWKGLIFGISYGLLARGVFAIDSQYFHTNGLMTLSFLFIVPFVIGFITAYYNREASYAGKIVAISMPLFSIIGVVFISLFFGMEGIICVLMALPIFALMALTGGFFGMILFKRRKNKAMVSFIMFIPFVIAPIEHYFGLNEKIFTEHTTILINSSKDRVWQNITRVKEISEPENNISLFQILGFPRPIKAELDTIAVGGVRKAIFAKGLFFTETVTKVIPNKNLTFTIEADPNSIPPTALDEHVMVGGKYFDVMEGKYEIEEITNNKIALHLTSKFRLSTNFNFYSGLWSKLIMRDIQKNILNIIKVRSESKQNSNS